MATAGKTPNKSTFLLDLFQKNPEINEREAVDAWRKAGNDGTISGSLFYTTKAALKRKADEGSGVVARKVEATRSAPKTSSAKATGKARAEAGVTTAAPEKERKSKPDDRERMLTDVEGDIDRIIFKLMVIGGLERIEDELRSVRRTVTRSHQA